MSWWLVWIFRFVRLFVVGFGDTFLLLALQDYNLVPGTRYWHEYLAGVIEIRNAAVVDAGTVLPVVKTGGCLETC